MACENPTIEIFYQPMTFFVRKQVFRSILPLFCLWVSLALARGEDSAFMGGLVVDSRDAMRKRRDIRPR